MLLEHKSLEPNVCSGKDNYKKEIVTTGACDF